MFIIYPTLLLLSFHLPVTTPHHRVIKLKFIRKNPILQWILHKLDTKLFVT